MIPSPVPAETTRTRWMAVLAAFLCGVAIATNVGKVPIALTQLREEFQLSLVTAGWVSSIFNTLAVFTAVFFGVIGDRLGARRMCFGGLAISMMGGVGGMLATSATALLLSRFVEGIGFLATAVSAPALISGASQPKDRRFALGIWACYLPAGVTLAMISAPLALPLDGWRGLWIESLALLALAAIAVQGNRTAYPVHPTGGSSAHFLATAKEALAQPLPWLLALCFGTWTIQHYSLIIWLPTFLREQRNFSATTIALLSSLMVLVNIPGNLIGGSLVQRNVSRGKLIACASLVTGLSGIGAFLNLLPDGLRYLCCLSLSFSGGLIPAAVISSSAVLARSPRQVGTLQGLYTQGSQLGIYVGTPAIAALVSASGSWQSAVYVTGIAAVAGISLGLVVWSIERRKP